VTFHPDNFVNKKRNPLPFCLSTAGSGFLKNRNVSLLPTHTSLYEDHKNRRAACMAMMCAMMQGSAGMMGDSEILRLIL
jgi:hypothetical protein